MFTFWKTLSLAVRVIIIVVLLAIVGAIIFLLVQKKNDDKTSKTESENNVEISQVFEPSIGTPLPADTTTGASTAEVENAGEVAGDSISMSAPLAGIDDLQPIKYVSDELGFSTTVPAKTEIVEQTGKVFFYSADSFKVGSDQKKLQAFVTKEANNSDTLATVKLQLENSPTVKNISLTTFGSNQALQFSSTQFGNGFVFLTKGNIYYVFGNQNIFQNFKI
jgi:flagellar basal body-associated protein FliL